MEAAIAPHELVRPSGSRSLHAIVGALIGVVIGTLVGVVVDLVVWVWAFGSSLADGVARDIPWLVHTSVGNDAVSASTEPGMIVIPVALLVIGAIAGAAIGARRRAAARSPYREG